MQTVEHGVAATTVKKPSENSPIKRANPLALRAKADALKPRNVNERKKLAENHGRRPLALQAGGHWFESSTAHQCFQALSVFTRPRSRASVTIFVTIHQCVGPETAFSACSRFRS